jgi:hypothetical protein
MFQDNHKARRKMGLLTVALWASLVSVGHGRASEHGKRLDPTLPEGSIELAQGNVGGLTGESSFDGGGGTVRSGATEERIRQAIVPPPGQRCESPVNDQELKALGRRNRLNQAFVRVTRKTMEAAQGISDRFWQQRHEALLSVVGRSVEAWRAKMRASSEANHQRVQELTISQGHCQRLARLDKSVCTDVPTAQDMGELCRAWVALRRRDMKASSPCATVSEEHVPLCHVIIEGREDACDPAVGSAQLACDTYLQWWRKGLKPCQTVEQRPDCLVALLLTGVGRGSIVCDEFEALGGWNTLDKQNVLAQCRAIFDEAPHNCVQTLPKINEPQRLEFHDEFVGALLGGQHGPRAVLVGASNVPALCRVNLVVKAQGVVVDKRSVSVRTFSGAADSLPLVAFNDEVDPVRDTLQLDWVCVLVMPWSH